MNTHKLETHKLITAILPKGKAVDTVKALKLQKDIIRTNINNARGVGKLTPLAYRGAGDQAEKEVLNVVVNAEQADTVFEFIYHHADINRPHGGLMYMSELLEATPFTLPELPEEK